VALTGDDWIAMIDTTTRKATRSLRVTGVPGRIVGIDVRPADGQLYALYVDGTVATIDPATGRATVKAKLETTLPPGVTATVDFNPMADRLRVIGSDGTNLRANVDDGKVAVDQKLRFAEGDPAGARAPLVVAGAYSNSVKGTQATALYDIDGRSGAYLRQAPPNDGILTTLGATGLNGAVAFDIESDGAGGNTGWLVAGATLYRLDIANGRTTALGRITGASAIRDVAVMK
jgi:hypothetical protein